MVKRNVHASRHSLRTGKLPNDFTLKVRSENSSLSLFKWYDRGAAEALCTRLSSKSSRHKVELEKDFLEEGHHSRDRVLSVSVFR
jgi:hypothetical protein